MDGCRVVYGFVYVGVGMGEEVLGIRVDFSEELGVWV